jgi:hypothetical protein
MPARRHKASKCSHLGFGSNCHRCAQADALDQKAKDHPNDKYAQAWTNEADRLRAPAGKKGPAATTNVAHHDPSEDLY